MQVITITLGLLLAGASFLLGRQIMISKRLRHYDTRNKKTISELKDSLNEAREQVSLFSGMCVELQGAVTLSRRSFEVGVVNDRSIVSMIVETSAGPVVIPVKSFCDPDDPDFALREAEEFKEQCEETI